jgi:hypothetical protein
MDDRPPVLMPRKCIADYHGLSLDVPRCVQVISGNLEEIFAEVGRVIGSPL